MKIHLISEDQFHDTILGQSLTYMAKTDTYEATVFYNLERPDLWAIYDNILRVPHVLIAYITVDPDEDEIRFYLYEEWQG